MGSTEVIIEKFRDYRPETTRQADFEKFWQETLEKVFKDSQDKEIDATNNSPVSFDLKLLDYPYPLNQVKIFKASLKASDHTTLHGWYLYPSQTGENKKVPALVRFHGYSSNKGKLCELLLWALQGYAVLAMDVRGQCGDTPDNRVYSSGSFSGWLTLGLNSPWEYYYRQVYLDSVQIVEALARRPEVDSRKIGLFGNSQGAALSLASAALLTRFADRFNITAGIGAVGAGVPFLCDMQKAYLEHRDGPWEELSWYFRMYDPLHKQEEKVFSCLSYFDILNFAPWVKSPVLIAVGLKDTACPPQTAFGLFNCLESSKEIVLYPDYGHENIDSHTDRQIAFFAEKLL